jgi:hypothetical protein
MSYTLSLLEAATSSIQVDLILDNFPSFFAKRKEKLRMEIIEKTLGCMKMGICISFRVAKEN